MYSVPCLMVLTTHQPHLHQPWRLNSACVHSFLGQHIQHLCDPAPAAPLSCKRAVPAVQPSQIPNFGVRYGIQIGQAFGYDFGYGILKDICTISFVIV